jgi:hypothetical protein
MQTLIATRQIGNSHYKNCVTTIKDCNGFVKAILTGYNQPKKTDKTIVVNKQNFNLKFN